MQKRYVKKSGNIVGVLAGVLLWFIGGVIRGSTGIGDRRR